MYLNKNILITSLVGNYISCYLQASAYTSINILLMG